MGIASISNTKLMWGRQKEKETKQNKTKDRELDPSLVYIQYFSARLFGPQQCGAQPNTFSSHLKPLLYRHFLKAD